MTKHTASRGYLLPPVFTVALRTAGIDPSRAWMSTCHVQLLVYCGREAEVNQHHGDLEGGEFHPTSSLLFHPRKEEKTDSIFPQKKRASV